MILPVTNTPKYSSKTKRNKSFKSISSPKNLYNSSKLLHKYHILKTNPIEIEKKFENMGVQAFFREGSEYARKFVSYCSLKTAEMFNKLHHVLPARIEMTNFKKINPNLENATGFCNFRTITQPKNYPLRTVVFNTFEEIEPIVVNGKKIPIMWENYDAVQQYSYDSGFLSVNHFMSPFIHEFAHSLHYHKLYSKYGCPELHPKYAFRPDSNIVIGNMNLKLDDKNPFVCDNIKNSIRKNISEYGADCLAEAFAEAYTQDMISCMDLYKLDLKAKPFPSKNLTPELHQVLAEIEEGMVGDGFGLI